MNRHSADDKERDLDPEKVEQERDDNRAWALKWDGAALAAMREKKGTTNRWDRP